MNTPFADAMAAIAHRGPRFFVPGHKGNPAAIGPFGPFLQYDLTEVDGACDLSRPEGPLAESQQNMAAAFGAGATLYSAAGTTSCIQAMLALFCGAGGRVVMARGAHVAAIRALALLGITPTWVPLQNGAPTPTAVDAALAQSAAPCVYVTSPDYYGRTAPIQALAAVCQKHGAALLVDNAHGAHLRFLQPGAHPLALGAAACADSAHKTLPCLTPAALLHLRNAALAARARECLNLFCSTSPAYPVLISLDMAAGWLLEAEAPAAFATAAQRLAAVAAAARALHYPCMDPLRLCLMPAAAHLDAGAFHQEMLARGLAPEYFDGTVLVYMASPFNTEEDYAALQDAMLQSAQHLGADLQDILFEPCKTLPPLPADAALAAPAPAPAMPLRTALFAPAQRLATTAATGRVLAGLHAPCPPGVPLVLPGQRIDDDAAALLCAGGILQVDVVK